MILRVLCSIASVACVSLALRMIVTALPEVPNDYRIGVAIVVMLGWTAVSIAVVAFVVSGDQK